jgi:hypothetical protein
MISGMLKKFRFEPVLRAQIRIRSIRMFLTLLDPDLDPFVRGTDSDPSIIKQRY